MPWGDDDDKSKIYASFLANVNEVKRLNQLPVPLKFEEDMDVKKLVTHQAKWHKSCYIKFNDTKLQRARKREIMMIALLYKSNLIYSINLWTRKNVFFAQRMMEIFMSSGFLMQMTM